MIHLAHLSCDSSKRPADGSKEYLKPILRLNWVIVCCFRGNFFASKFIIINDCFHILGCFFLLRHKLYREFRKVWAHKTTTQKHTGLKHDPNLIKSAGSIQDQKPSPEESKHFSRWTNAFLFTPDLHVAPTGVSNGATSSSPCIFDKAPLGGAARTFSHLTLNNMDFHYNVISRCINKSVQRVSLENI